MQPVHSCVSTVLQCSWCLWRGWSGGGGRGRLRWRAREGCWLNTD